MATEDRGQARGPIEPLVSVATEGVALGYQALELVVTGLREGLRLQPGSSSGPAATSAAALRARRSTGSGPAAPARAAAGGLTSDLAAIAGEVFKRAGAAADEVARAIPKQAQAPGPIPELAAEVAAGNTAKVPFSIWNTNPTVLKAVSFAATDLIGVDTSRLGAEITFDPPRLGRIGPGKGATVQIMVAVPPGTPAGTYRALVQAEPPDTCAVLQLSVTAGPEAGAGPQAAADAGPAATGAA